MLKPSRECLLGKQYIHIVPKNEFTDYLLITKVGAIYLNVERFSHCYFNQVVKYGINNGLTFDSPFRLMLSSHIKYQTSPFWGISIINPISTRPLILMSGLQKKKSSREKNFFLKKIKKKSQTHSKCETSVTNLAWFLQKGQC